MKFAELKKGDKVFDRWYPDWGPGFIVKKLKTRVIILFENMNIYTYDKPHARYLAPVEAATPIRRPRGPRKPK